MGAAGIGGLRHRAACVPAFPRPRLLSLPPNSLRPGEPPAARQRLFSPGAYARPCVLTRRQPSCNRQTSCPSLAYRTQDVLSLGRLPAWWCRGRAFFSWSPLEGARLEGRARPRRRKASPQSGPYWSSWAMAGDGASGAVPAAGGEPGACCQAAQPPGVFCRARPAQPALRGPAALWCWSCAPRHGLPARDKSGLRRWGRHASPGIRDTLNPHPLARQVDVCAVAWVGGGGVTPACTVMATSPAYTAHLAPRVGNSPVKYAVSHRTCRLRAPLGACGPGFGNPKAQRTSLLINRSPGGESAALGSFLVSIKCISRSIRLTHNFRQAHGPWQRRADHVAASHANMRAQLALECVVGPRGAGPASRQIQGVSTARTSITATMQAGGEEVRTWYRPGRAGHALRLPLLRRRRRSVLCVRDSGVTRG